MRIDRFLHCIRLVKSRTAAQALIEQGHIRVDGKRVLKCAGEISAGQVIALPLRGSVRILRVTALPARRSRPGNAFAALANLKR